MIEVLSKELEKSGIPDYEDLVKQLIEIQSQSLYEEDRRPITAQIEKLIDGVIQGQLEE